MIYQTIITIYRKIITPKGSEDNKDNKDSDNIKEEQEDKVKEY